VNPFFVSEDRLGRQAYRYDGRYRLAAFTLLVSVSLQLPLLVFFYCQNQIQQEEAGRLEFDLRKKAELASEIVTLKETEGQLSQIKSWEPIIRGRMPTSAVLGTLEQTIPRDAVLSRIVLEGANYRSVSFGKGSFRVPEAYTITLEGDEKTGDPGVWQKFIGTFLSKLPPGSKVVTSSLGNEKNPKDGTVTCKAVLQARANGNYFSLGVKKIETEENL
jgi:hypothetical protein